MKERMRIGLYSLSSCEGCIVEILNMEDKLLEILKHVEIVDCRLLGITGEGNIDIAFVEGFISSNDEEEKIREIRKKARVLVAMGDCACSGGRFLIKDFGEASGIRADPIDKIIKVDYYLWGCPVNSEEFLILLRDIIQDKKPREISKTVCSECVFFEKECLLDKGILCLGPITRGGCNALCLVSNRACFGCRGLSEDANIGGFIKILKEKGIEVPDYLKKLSKVMKLGEKAH